MYFLKVCDVNLIRDLNNKMVIDCNNSKIRYLGYARKSTEDKNRQVQSIDDQIAFINRKVKEQDLPLLDIHQESKSAKEPGIRTAFYKMVERIESGDAEGILCWKLDRLSRNPVDTARVQWLLQKGKIKSIVTSDREYLPEHSGLLFSVETGMANQDILNLSQNVKRGLKSKVEKGHYPNKAPVGYLNTKSEAKGENYIIPDPERFDLVRKMWDLYLTGRYTVAKILKIVNEEWGFKTKGSKKRGGKGLSPAAIYRLFADIKYTGTHFYSKGELSTNGKAKPMITLEEFDRAQEILGRKGKPRPKTREFAYNCIIRCGECGYSIIGEIKKEKYIFYHCTKKGKGVKCNQKKWIRVEDLESQIKREIDSFTIAPWFRDKQIAELKENHAKEAREQENIHETQQKTILSCQKQLNTLLDIRLNNQITDEEYQLKRNQLLKQISDLEQRLKETQNRVRSWVKTFEGVFNFATQAHAAFLKGNLETKKKILLALGQNFTLKGKILKLEPNPLLIPIKENYPKLKEEYDRLELDETGSTKQKEEALQPLLLLWRGRRDSNSRPHA